MDMNYGGECGREGGGQDGVEWGGKWDNYNSIINKYIFFKNPPKVLSLNTYAGTKGPSPSCRSAHR